MEKDLINLPHFTPEEHTIVTEFSLTPTIFELTSLCSTRDKPKSLQPITCTSVDGEQVRLFLKPQEMLCLPDEHMSESDFAPNAPTMARYALVKVAKDEGGEPKFWLVVCSSSLKGWLVFYGDYPDEVEGGVTYFHFQDTRVAAAEV